MRSRTCCSTRAASAEALSERRGWILSERLLTARTSTSNVSSGVSRVARPKPVMLAMPATLGVASVTGVRRRGRVRDRGRVLHDLRHRLRALEHSEAEGEEDEEHRRDARRALPGHVRLGAEGRVDRRAAGEAAEAATLALLDEDDEDEEEADEDEQRRHEEREDSHLTLAPFRLALGRVLGDGEEGPCIQGRSADEGSVDALHRGERLHVVG